MPAPESRRKLKLSREQRLQKSWEFQQIRSRGRRVTRGCLIANWVMLEPGKPSRVGVITSRRIGHAPERSRARRLLREVFRLHQHDFNVPVEMALVARPSIAGKEFANVERDFLAILREAGLKKKE